MTCTARPVRPETVVRAIRRAESLEIVTLLPELVVETDPAATLFAPDAVTVASTGRGRPVLVLVGGNVEDGSRLADALREAMEDDDYEVTDSEHLGRRAFYVSNYCEGHESLRGDAMGASLFCDGSIR